MEFEFWRNIYDGIPDYKAKEALGLQGPDELRGALMDFYDECRDVGKYHDSGSLRFQK